MSFLEILILALALSADAVSVGAAVGLHQREARQMFRLSFHCGLFQSLMALVGAAAGAAFLGYVQDYDHWVVFSVLALIGARMIYLAVRDHPPALAGKDLSRGLSLVLLSLAVSVDAFGAGIGLPAAHAPLTLAVSVIGVVAFATTLLAMLAAERIKSWVGRRCELAAGIVLIGLGAWSPMDHLGLLSR